MKTHLGLCVKCAKTEDCLETTQGSMCRPCFHALLISGKETVASIPELDMEVFVLVWAEDPVEFLSIRQVIYCFPDAATAQRFLKEDLIPSSTESFSSVRVKSIAAIALVSYCLRHPGLKVMSLEPKKQP